MGRAAGGGTGRSWGMGKFKIDVARVGYRTRSAGPVKLKKTSKANTEMQTTVIIASSVLGYLARNSVALNHAIILPADTVRANGPRVTFVSVLSYRTSGYHTPRSGTLSRASLKRLVKFAMQMVRVSSTICPSS